MDAAAERHARGVERHNAGDFEGAVREYNAALQLEPANATFLNDRGIARKNIGDLEGALADYAAAAAADPAFWPAYANRGNLLSKLRRFAEAERDLDRGLQAAPAEPTLYFYRGNARACRMNYPGAVEDYTRTLELAPDKAEAWFCRGVALRTIATLTGADGEVFVEGDSFPPDPARSRQLLERALADFERADALLPPGAWEREELADDIREIRQELGL
jgi:tetratricopeptide (TPR) repeat protein